MADLQRAESGLTRQDVIRGPELFLVTAFISLALYNFMELNALIFTTFKKRRGVYFWSMLAATWGVALNAIGYLLKFLLPSSSTALDVISTILVLAGWCAMITGQSVVLYSRLHLLVYDHFTIRLVLAMIIIDAAICHPPTISLFCLINNTRNPDPFIPAYSIYEKVQLFIFFIQEFVISAIYIIESAKFLRSRKGMSGGNGQLPPSSGGVSLTDSNRMIMYWLISVNVLVVLLDVSILALELSGYYDLQTSWKAFVYSLKLKLEFCILNKLIAVVKTRNPDLFDSAGGKLRSLGGRRASVRNVNLTFTSDSSARQKKDTDVDHNGGAVAVEVQSPPPPFTSSASHGGAGGAVEDASAVIALGPVVRTKERNSSRFEMPWYGDGKIPNFSVLRTS